MISKTIGEAKVEISGNASGLKKSLARAQSGISKFKTKAAAAFRSVGASAKKIAIGIGTVVAAIAAVGAAVFKTIGSIDEMAKSASTIGLTAEQFQRLNFAAEQSGVNIDQVKTSMLNLQAAQVEAINKTGLQRDAFARLGITVDDLKNNSPKQIFDLIANGIKNIGSQKDAVKVMKDIRINPKIINLLKQGAEGINTLGDSLAESAIISNETAAEAEALNDRYNELLTTLSGPLKTAAVTAGGVMFDAFDKLVKLFNRMKGIVSNLGIIFQDELTAIGKGFELLMAPTVAVIDFLGEKFDSFLGIAEEVTTVSLALVENLSRADLSNLSDEGLATAMKANNEAIRLLAKSTSGLTEAQTEEIITRSLNVKTMFTEAEARKELIKTTDEQTAADKKESLALEDQQKKRQKVAIEMQRIANEKIESDKKASATKKDKPKEDTPDDIEETTLKFKQQSEIIADSAQQAARTISSSLANAAISGELSFKSMFETIAAGFLQMQLQQQIFGPLLQAASNGLGTFFGTTPAAAPAVSGARAAGGQVSIGNRFLVGENGPELFIPRVDGSINPNFAAGNKSSKQNVKVTINNSGEPKNAQVNTTETASGLLVNVILNDLETNGSISKTMGKSFGLNRVA